jgi:hypothetical protein
VRAGAIGGPVNVVDGLWLTARVQVPFYALLNGVQSIGPTFLVGVQYQVL